MISEKGFVFRKGRTGDKTPHGYPKSDENDAPAFVLELNNTLVVSACGGENFIFIIESFDRCKGYCTKFLELWEKYAKEKGYTELIVSQVNNQSLEHILEKGKFSFKLDKQNEKIYSKNISQKSD
jgi:hypothetical protein